MRELRDALETFVREACTLLRNVDIPMRQWLRMEEQDDGQTRGWIEERPDYAALVGIISRNAEHVTSFGRVVQAVRDDATLAASLLGVFGRPITEPAAQAVHLMDELGRPLLEAYFAQAQRVAFRPEVFEVVYRQLRADIEAPTYSVTQLAPLLAVRLTVDEVALGPGLRLRRVSEEEVERWLNTRFGIGDNLLEFGHTPPRCAVEVTFQRERAEQLFSQSEKAGATISRLVSALQLLTGRHVKTLFIAEQPHSIVWGLASMSRGMDPSPFTDEPADFDEADRDRLIRLMDLLEHSPKAEQYELALRRWATGLGRTRADDKLIDYWIALESLFTPDSTQEVIFRATLRIAGFVGRTASERERIYAGLRHAYAWRSAVVHGANEGRIRNLTKNGDLAATTAKTQIYLRDALLHIIESDEPFDPEKIEHHLLRNSAPED